MPATEGLPDRRKPQKPKVAPIDNVHMDELLELVVEYEASDLHLCNLLHRFNINRL